MTDPKILVFGSFTEDEMKTLQCQAPRNHVQITFGSLDSATLRSVGIFEAEQLESGHYNRNQPLEGAKSENIVKTACTYKNRLKVEVTTVGNKQGVGSCRNAQDIVALNELAISYEFDHSSSMDKFDSALHGFGNLSVSSGQSVTEALICASSGVGLLNCRGSSHKASKWPVKNGRTLVPRGLVNLGNLCFLNSSLQALISCSPFVQLLHELRTLDIPKEMILETGKPFRPLMFETILRIFTPDVSNSLSGRTRQEDVQEFLSFLMHQMHDELLKFEGKIPNGNEGRGGLISSMTDEDENNLETASPRNETAITRAHSFIPSKLSAIFGGQLKSVVKATGNKASATIQPFLLLHLNICPEPVSTIEDALHLFSEWEALEGYRTSESGKAEVISASKSIKILDLPEVMILHLMRFSYGREGSTKLHKPVHFPLELILGSDLLVSPPSERRRYELVATITHHGREPWKGHYTVDSCQANGKWLHYDDASVTPISTSKVLHGQAYVLFYKQV